MWKHLLLLQWVLKIFDFDHAAAQLSIAKGVEHFFFNSYLLDILDCLRSSSLNSFILDVMSLTFLGRLLDEPYLCGTGHEHRDPARLRKAEITHKGIAWASS